jgi:hypothetical protein
MKTSKRYRVKPDKIHSLMDIELETQRLRLEILKKEQEIHFNYQNILHTFTFRNLASAVVNEISTSQGVVSKAFAIGRSIMGKRKKKKHDKLKSADAELKS